MRTSATHVPQAAPAARAPWGGGATRRFVPVEERAPAAEAAAAPGFSFDSVRIQPKLTVGAPDDPLEAEADETAERVMRMPEHAWDGGRAMQPAPGGVLQRACAGCDDEEKVQRKSEGGVASEAAAPPIVHETLRASGQPLDAATRAFMEPRFGHDFSRVRVHADAPASASARALHAQAYTVGRDIVFREGAFAPATAEGRRLVAHELAHVVQQSGARAVVRRRLESGAVLAGPDDPEQEPVPMQDPPAKPPGGAPPPAKPPPAKPACLPVILNPIWDLAPGPILSMKSPCDLQFARAMVAPGSGFGLNGMEFKGTVSMPVTCPGTVYFVQYAKPDRSFIGCLDAKELGFCIKPPLGLDGAWPYAHGSQVNTDQNAGSSVPFNTIDTPEQKNISNPIVEFVRLCVEDSFTTYIVFEDKAANLTSLGWWTWSYTAHAERDAGTCPRKTTSSDCAGWTVTGKSTKGSSDFTVGAMAPTQKLDRTVKPVSKSLTDCPVTSCPKPGAAPAPVPDKPAPAPDKPAPDK